ncbi:uncharacterized protein LOC111268991 isoform X1 [Varroa jacobsoni]|uniref:Uncharacterized protein n=1 Tax=Varroa destructor TaxID=109461 RepID=A0A7M7KNK1_VARDE|nr:uncharacterized protein LOC111253430 isoform X2 [Varroa destructor]XP_022668530.1 uncharacterized protein LOC111253431 isoform X1 [Varroa destructor]XP_022668532.1 uncharacterized protein LOC111253431 isoform X1 [Varroa destructor]XP_022704016.1 uncharacterized protein LOC111268991 isoform X1 [Varroa jacobsoni]XP_022704017.1 uncharacterized protein LOC111268991 isoform X1 [Varroa jacobsoni]
MMISGPSCSTPNNADDVATRQFLDDNLFDRMARSTQRIEQLSKQITPTSHLLSQVWREAVQPPCLEFSSRACENQMLAPAIAAIEKVAPKTRFEAPPLYTPLFSDALIPQKTSLSTIHTPPDTERCPGRRLFDDASTNTPPHDTAILTASPTS